MKKNSKYVLKDYNREMLHEGNRSVFAHEVLEAYPEICKEAGWDFKAACNYRGRVDFNDDIEQIFTLWGKNGVKYFFNSDLQFRGTKF